MKFKSSNKQNQRIEKITSSHLVVGIDIAKETHVSRSVNFRGIEQGRTLSFTNELEGFQSLLAWIHSLQTKLGFTEVIIGLEPTGHYWMNLADWLMEQKIEVVLVNPLTTKRNKENRDNSPSKNDAKDALTIADVVSRGYYMEYRKQDRIYKRLRAVMNEREYWSDLRVNLCNRISRWFDIYFPEFSLLFKDWTGSPRAIATLKEFPLPADITQRSIDQLIQGWKAHMKRPGGKSGLQKAADLLHIAKRSVGETHTLQEARREIKHLLDEYERISLCLQEIDQHVGQLLSEIPHTYEQLSSIKGLLPSYIAFILANTGDLRHYKHGRQLLSLAGLNLAESTSGKTKGQIVISKRGRRQLRKYLFLAVLRLVGTNPAFKQWHEYNINIRKMTNMRSIFKLIGKLARILVAMAQSGESFQAQKAMALSEAA